jgi:hypothetical protein
LSQRRQRSRSKVAPNSMLASRSFSRAPGCRRNRRTDRAAWRLQLRGPAGCSRVHPVSPTRRRSLPSAPSGRLSGRAYCSPLRPACRRAPMRGGRERESPSFA